MKDNPEVVRLLGICEEKNREIEKLKKEGDYSQKLYERADTGLVACCNDKAKLYGKYSTLKQAILGVKLPEKKDLNKVASDQWYTEYKFEGYNEAIDLSQAEIDKLKELV